MNISLFMIGTTYGAIPMLVPESSFGSILVDMACIGRKESDPRRIVRLLAAIKK